MKTHEGILSSIIACLFVITMIFALYHPVQAASDGSASQEEMDAFIEESLNRENIPGMAVTIVRNGMTTYTQGFGVTCVEDGIPVTPDTVFDLASCSKSFTALGVLLLENDGLLDTDLPVNHYLTDLKFADKDEGAQITVRQLLNHTSGLPGVFSEPMAFHKGENAMTKLIEAMENVHLNREPGTSFEYSNMNYSILGALIERVSGQPFEDYMKEHIFTPLGMENTTLDPETATAHERARGHQLMFGKVVPRDIEIYRSASAAGWVMSTARDMAKWLTVHLEKGMLEGQQVFPARLIEETHAPAVSYDQNGEDVSYGMGWLRARSMDGTEVIWHGGDTPNFVAEMILVPEYHAGIVMLVNGQISPYIHTIATDILNRELRHDLLLPEAPWWSSWEAIDRVATGALGLSLIFLLGLFLFIWRKVGRQRPPVDQRTPYHVWKIVLPSAPIVVTSLGMIGIFLITQMFLGYNIFKTLIRFREYAPPGVSISAILLIVILILWILALAGTAIYRISKNAKN